LPVPDRSAFTAAAGVDGYNGVAPSRQLINFYCEPEPVLPVWCKFNEAIVLDRLIYLKFS